MFKTGKMQYRNLGNSGLKVSVVSLGTFTNSETSVEEMLEILKTSLQNGINYFDTALSYVDGKIAETFGEAFKRTGEEREKIVVSTKIFSSPQSFVNSKQTLNKKHVRQNLKKTLKALQMDYVDIAFAHTYDEDTGIEEVCRAFHEAIEDGDAFYWGTSNWDADQVYRAFEVCEKLGLHKPICAQNQYNMLERAEIESEYRKLFECQKYGLVAFSPLFGGYLTGKYLKQNCEGRFSSPNSGGWSKEILKSIYVDKLDREKTDNILRELQKIAKEELHCELTHLAIAWVINFKHSSTSLIGARNSQQLEESLGVLGVLEKMSEEVEGRVNKLLQTQPKPRMDFRSFAPTSHIRPLAP